MKMGFLCLFSGVMCKGLVGMRKVGTWNFFLQGMSELLVQIRVLCKACQLAG